MLKTSKPAEFSVRIAATRNPKRAARAVTLHANAKAALALSLPEIRGPFGSRSDRLAIVCSGASVRASVADIFAHKGPVWALNGAHDFLLERGLVPTACVLLDPQDFDACRVKITPTHGVTYYIASQCAPSTFERFKGYDVRVWHALDGGKPMLKILTGKHLVTGGATVGLRSINLAYYLGFRTLDMFGLDGSAGAGETHCADDPDRLAHNLTLLRPFWVEGRLFSAIPTYAMQAAQLARLVNVAPPDLDLTLHGDGLVQHYIGAANERASKRLPTNGIPGRRKLWQRNAAPNFQGRDSKVFSSASAEQHEVGDRRAPGL